MSKIDDGVCLGFWDRVKVFLVFGVKISLVKKMGLYMLKFRMCVWLFYCVFLWIDFICKVEGFFLLVLIWNMVNVFLWIVGDVIIFFLYWFVYFGLKFLEKKIKYEFLIFLFYGIKWFFFVICVGFFFRFVWGFFKLLFLVVYLMVR